MILPSGLLTPWAFHFQLLFEAQSHASAYGLQPPLSTLDSSCYLLNSKTKYGWMVSLPDRHFSRLLIKRLVAHQEVYYKIRQLYCSRLYACFIKDCVKKSFASCKSLLLLFFMPKPNKENLCITSTKSSLALQFLAFVY